jgi:hypothetical protein
VLREVILCCICNTYHCCVWMRSRVKIAFLQKRLAAVDEVEGADSAVSCKGCRSRMQLLRQGALVAERQALVVPQAQVCFRRWVVGRQPASLTYDWAQALRPGARARSNANTLPRIESDSTQPQLHDISVSFRRHGHLTVRTADTRFSCRSAG